MKLVQKILNQEIAIARSCDSGAKHSATSQARFGRNYIQLELPRQTRIAASRHNSSMVTASMSAASDVSSERSEVGNTAGAATNGFDSNAIGSKLGLKSKVLLRSADAIRDNYPSLCAHLLVNKKIKSGVFLYTPSSSQIYMSLGDGLKQTDRRLRDTSKSTVRVSQLQSTLGVVGDHSVDNSKAQPIVNRSKYRRLVSLMTQPSISTRKLHWSEHSLNDLGAIKQLEALKNERSKLIDRRDPKGYGVESGLLLATRFVSSGPKSNLPNAVISSAANASRAARKTHGRSRNNYDSLAKLAPTDWINLVVGYYLRH